MGNQNDLFEGLAMTAAENALKPATAAGGSPAPANSADSGGSAPPAARSGNSGGGGGLPPDFAPFSGEFGDTLPLAKYAALQYLQYAVSTVKDRALPRVADGQKPVQVEDAALDADRSVFNMMMGKENASQRREWMETYGNLVDADIS